MSDKRMQVIIDRNIDDYLDFANDSESEVRKTSPPALDLLRDVDLLIRDVLSGPIEADPIPMVLSMNAYYLFMAAVRMALAGHVGSILPVARAALESAGYAFLLTQDPSLVSVWVNRDRGEAERKACRKAFTNALSDAVKKLRVVQAEAADYVQGLYDSSITYGAHPNPSGIFVHAAEPSDAGDRWIVPFACMYESTSYQTAHGLFVCAEFGIGVAYLNAQCVSSHPRAGQLQARFDAVGQSKNQMERCLRDGSWKGSV